MSKTQCYIGAPNGVVLCVDSLDIDQGILKGRFWHGYSMKPVEITNAAGLLMEMEKLFDKIRFPYPTTTLRTFGDEHAAVSRFNEMERVMADEVMLQKHGDLGTFIIRVQHRQNSSWQGRITWMEEDKTQNFRSIWEMIKLIESALDTVDPEDMPEEVNWQD